jgi:hypothetical protein
LLPKSEDFQGCIASCTEENPECKQESEEELNHELTVVTWRNGGSIGPSARSG